MRTGSLPILVTLIVSSTLACDPSAPSTRRPPASDQRPSAGEITFAIGPELRNIPFHRAVCSEDERGRTIVLEGTTPLATRADTAPYPDVIIARIPPEGEVTRASEPEFGATLFAPAQTFEGVEHEMLMLVARPADGAPEFNCRLTLENAANQLVCNSAHVMPWKLPGKVPTGSFKASFECVGDDGEAPAK